MRARPFKAAACAICLLVLAPVSKGAEDEFSLSVTPYVWFAGVTGDIGVGRVKTDVDASFLDIFDESDSLIGFFGRAEGRYRRFGLYLDGGYVQVSKDRVSGPLGLANFDVTQSTAVIDFGLMYRLIDGRDQDSRFALDATVGARYWHMAIELDPALIGNTLDGEKDWIDPTVGLRSTIGIGRNWEIVVGGDIGGIDQFTWSAIGTIGYAFKLGPFDSSIFAGYKAIGADYTDGGFTWDAALHGPVIGCRFTF